MSGACERYRDDLVAEACGALPASESRSLARHVAACPACRRDLDRLRAALAPLAAYDPEPPPRLVELTQRHVARQMTMRLPRPGRLSRPRVLRLAMAAARGLTRFGTTLSVASSSATSNSVPRASTSDGCWTPQYLRVVRKTLIGSFSKVSLRTSNVVVRDFTSTKACRSHSGDSAMP